MYNALVHYCEWSVDMLAFEKLPKQFQTNEVKIYYDHLAKRKTALMWKRVFDIVVSAVLLVLLSPILLLLAVWIKVDSEGPVFYRQVRVTTYGKEFRIFKFRTMVKDADKMGALVTSDHDPRISRAGNKLRNLRLDELPQLINVLIGDMSFVGTRPEVPRYVERYTSEMFATLLLPAGVTSLASMRYKDEAKVISEYTSQGLTPDEVYITKVLPEKMKYNLEYLEDVSVIRDIRLMIDTVFAVVK